MDIRNLVVEVRDKDLNRLGQIAPGDLDLLAEDQHNNVGSWTLNLRSDHQLAGALRTPGAGLIICDTSGTTLMSGPVTQTDDKATVADPAGTLTVNGLTDMLVLADRRAFPDPANADPETQAAAYDVRTGVAEDVMHAFVDANVGPSAPAGRQIASLTLGPNGHRGATLTKRARFDALGNLVNEVALTSGLGFRVRQIGTGLIFETFAISDRRAEVRYDIRNNMLAGHSAQAAPPGVTRAIVGGDGSKLDRPIVEVTTAASLAAETLWGRRIEQFIDQRSSADTDELTQAGQEALQDAGFAQTGIQVVPMEDIGVGDFGNQYTLGDIVTVVVTGVEYAVQVTGYVLKHNAEGLRFGLVLGNPLGNQESTHVTARVTKLEGRVSHLERNAEGGSGALDKLTDVAVTSPATGDVLQWDDVSGTWANGQLAMTDLTDTAITSPAAGEILQWDDGNSTWTHKDTVTVDTVDANTVDAAELRVAGTNILEHVWPVGSVYISAVATDPATLFGFGTWLALGGRFLVGADGAYPAGSTGGTTTQTLSTSQLPAHSHDAGTLQTDAEASHTHSFSATTSSDTHDHKIGRDKDGATGTGEYVIHSTGLSGAEQHYDGALTNDTHNHSVSGTTGSGGSHSHDVTGASGATGSGDPVSIMPPYLAAHMWQRTA